MQTKNENIRFPQQLTVIHFYMMPSSENSREFKYAKMAKFIYGRYHVKLLLHFCKLEDKSINTYYLSYNNGVCLW